MLKRLTRLLIAASLFAVLSACQAAREIPVTHGSATEPSPTAPAAAGPVPPVAAPLYGEEASPQPLNLEVKVIKQVSGEAGYTIKARYPYLTGSASPYLAAFNQAVEEYVTGQLNSFYQSLAESQDASGMLEIDFLPTMIDTNVVSALLKTTTFLPGSAHTSTLSYAFNYDLERGQVLSLSDLFQSGAPYLQALSDASIETLRARGSLQWEAGALPREENFRAWNITPEGLLITFDEYRVASYDAGPQTVLIPYSRLQQIIRAGGPLEGLIAD